MGIGRITAHRYDEAAAHYEDEPGHGIQTGEERTAWMADLSRVLDGAPGRHVVDVGTGTGVLARLLAENGYRVDGVDISLGMIERARELLPSSLLAKVSYRVGDAQDDLFPAASVDAVVSRQVVCHLDDPIRAFRSWRRWLRPGGLVVVIDGFWGRKGWTGGPLADAVDQLPLSCVQTIGTAAYLLAQAELAVEHRGWLQAVNDQLAAADPGATERSPRYVVVARKAPEGGERGSS